MRTDVAPRRRRRSGWAFGIAPRIPVVLVSALLVALVATAVILLDHGRPTQASHGYSAGEIEKANLKILPFRQSGLIFHWADDSPTVYVRRSMWEELPEEAKWDLGRTMAVAKNKEQITILDETLAAKLAVCTAKGRCKRVKS